MSSPRPGKRRSGTAYVKLLLPSTFTVLFKIGAVAMSVDPTPLAAVTDDRACSALTAVLSGSPPHPTSQTNVGPFCAPSGTLANSVNRRISGTRRYLDM